LFICTIPGFLLPPDSFPRANSLVFYWEKTYSFLLLEIIRAKWIGKDVTAMRILMLSWEFPPRSVGGLSQHVFELSRALVAGGIQVELITAGGDELPEHEVMEGIGVWRVNPYHGGNERDFIDWVQRLNFALLEQGAVLSNREGKYDLVHAHDWLVTYAARGLKHIYNMPLLATIHATEFGRNNGLYSGEQRYISDIEWLLTYEAWKVICCSKYMEEELKHVFHLPGDKIKIIPNGIRPEAYRPADKKPSLERFHFNHDQKIVFYIGRLVQEKGIQILLEAAPIILERYPQTTFVIAGKGPFEANLKNRARELGLEGKVHFLGYIDDQARNELYHAAAVAIFPSLYEPFGIVALEAMASGTPVVVSSVGGLDEIVEHEIDGLKIYPNDAWSLAEQVCRILGAEDWAASLAEKAYVKAINVYSWEKIARQTAELYEEIIFSPENKRWQESALMERRWDEVTAKKGGEQKKKSLQPV
jgi:glycosyltransferase involved in cell wall biosynthesis